jgi:hypothetical protein
MSEHSDTRETRNYAREIKFILDDATAAGVRGWARAHLHADMHGQGADGDEYTTTTIYFDTGTYDVFHRRRSYGRCKFRVRRYGTSDIVFFERKLRTSGLLVKRRTATDIEDLARLGHDRDRDARWPANWFHQRVHVRRLHPVCRVSYDRTARVGFTAYGAMRLTLDTNLAAVPVSALDFVTGGPPTPFDTGRTILELKYRVEMPAIFKRLAETFQLVPETLSKYRLAIAALGLAAPETETGPSTGTTEVPNA